MERPLFYTAASATSSKSPGAPPSPVYKMMYLLASSTLAFSGVSKLAASRVAAPRAAPAQMFTVNLVTPDGPQTVRSMLTCMTTRDEHA